MSYGMQYTAVAVATAKTVESDIIEITAPADASVLVTSIYLSAPLTADMGDAQAESLKVQFIKGYTVSGSTGVGAAITCTPLQSGFAAQGSVVDTHNTTLANTGTPLTLHEDIYNSQIGYQWRPAPNEYIVLSPSQRLVVRVAAPADSITIAGTLNFTEIGG
jgi:hypothetical protein